MMFEGRGTRKGYFFCCEVLRGGDALGGAGRPAGDALCDGETAADLKEEWAVVGGQRLEDVAC